MIDVYNEIASAQLLVADVRTSSANGTGVDIQDYIGKLKLVLDSEEGTGNADNTLDVKIQHSDASGSGYTDITGAAFTQVDGSTAAFESISLDTRSTKRYIRAVATIAGTSPSYATSVILHGVKARS